jgi:hypothetical protein
MCRVRSQARGRRRDRRASYLIGALAGVAVALLPAAASADEWTAATELSNGSTRGAQQLVLDVDPLGDAVAAWKQAPADDIGAAYKKYGAPAGAPQNYAGDYDDPDVAIGGNSVAVLAFEDNSAPDVYAASKAAGSSSFSGTRAFTGDGVGPPYNDPPSAEQPGVAVNAQGTGMLFFARDYYYPPNYTGIAEAIEGRSLTNPATNSWNGGTDLNGSVNDPRETEISVGADGSAFLGISAFEQGPCWGLDTAVLENSGLGSSDPENFALSCGGNAPYNGIYPSNDRLPNSDIVMAFHHKDDGSVWFLDLPKARAIAGSSNLESQEVRIDAGNGTQTGSGKALVRTDAAGNATVVWYDSNDTGSGNERSILARTRPFGGSWGPTEVISSGEDYSGELDFDVDDAGNAYVVYGRTESGSGNEEIAASERATGGSWTAPELLSENQGIAGEPRVAAGREGQAVASWIANGNDGVFYAENAAPACSDGLDNDHDGKTDFPADPGCSSAADRDEADQVDKSPPQGDASGNGKSKAGKPIKLTVRSSEDGSVVASGTQNQISKPKKGKARKVKVKLATAHEQIGADEPMTLKLKPQGKKNKKTAKKLKKAVKKGARAEAKLKITFADEAGNKSTRRLTLKLK